MLNEFKGNGRHILVVDDEPLIRRSLSELLTLQGFAVSSANNGREALELLKDFRADIVISDIKMPEMDGIQLLKEIKIKSPQIEVIMITGHASINNAVEAIKNGAYDYVSKPIIDNEINICIERLIKHRLLQDENAHLKERLSIVERESFHNIVGRSQSMQKIYNLIEAVTNTRATVLINGESGTGKRMIAHAIHKNNAQERSKPFVEVSCGALTETLLESELFGHVRGSFTGAIKDRLGRFELANGGSIFLDEIDAFSTALQVKLLRVLQEGELERVGDTKTLKVDVRVIAATNQNLQELIKQGKFRLDLYYRLNIISIEIPPLRERKEDIPLLVDVFIQKHLACTSKKIKGISEEFLSMLMNYDWPGNIRELENVIERATILCKGPILQPHDLPDSLDLRQKTQGPTPIEGESKVWLKEALKEPEMELISKALEKVSGNRNEAAKALGINRTTLYKKMCKYGLFKKNVDK